MNNLHAQVTQQWAARYNGTANINDKATSIAVDASGNVYVTGVSEGSGSSGDIVTIKYNSAGDSLWVKRYNGPGNGYDYAGSITMDGSGNVYVAGGVLNAAANYDFILIKYNSSGAQLWVATYNGTGNSDDVITAMTLDVFGNINVTGYSVGSGTSYDYTTIKYNSAGDSLWVRRYNGPGNNEDYPGSIVVDNTGNVYITGASIGNGTGDDYATIKYNSSGVQQWVSRYNGPGNDDDAAGSVAIDTLGNVYITGASYGNGTNLDYATIKYNFAGVQQWVSRYNGPGNNNEAGNSIVLDKQGNVYVSGTVDAPGAGKDFATIKYNSSGVQQWFSDYNGTGNGADNENSLLTDSEGNLYVTGYSFGGATGNDYAAVKYNNAGVLQWTARYSETGNGSDVPGASAIDSSGNIYVTGTSFITATGYDFLTVKYSQPNAIHTVSSEIPKQFSLSQNYPNPFNPTTKIKFAIPKESFVKITIFDIPGREVSTLVNEELKTGIYEVDFSATGGGNNLSSGVYFYKLIASQAGSSTGDYVETKKMILLK